MKFFCQLSAQRAMAVTKMKILPKLKVTTVPPSSLSELIYPCDYQSNLISRKVLSCTFDPTVLSLAAHQYWY